MPVRTAPIQTASVMAVLGTAWTLRVIENSAGEAAAGPNTAEHFGPVVRFGAPLMMAFRDQDLALSSDSYQQPSGTQNAGGVASHSWSSDGRVGGGSGSSATYNWSSTGLKEVTLTVTDDNGVEGVGRRSVRVVDPPGQGTQSAWPLTNFTYDGPHERFGEGLGGATLNITFYNDPNGTTVDSLSEQLIPGRQIALFIVEREGTTYDTLTTEFRSLLFSGFVVKTRMAGSRRERWLVAECGTIDALMEDNRLSGSDMAFVDRVFFDKLKIEDPPGSGTLVLPPTKFMTTNPLHVITNLTTPKVVDHYLRWHLYADRDGSTHRLIELTGLRADWWNHGSDAIHNVWVAGVPRGNVARALVSALPQGAWLLYCSVRSELTFTRIHVGKTSADPVLDSLLTSEAIDPQPIKGKVQPYAQVRIVQTPESLDDIDQETLVVFVPENPLSGGGDTYQASGMSWIRTQEAAENWGSALLADLNATDEVEWTEVGTKWGLHNKVSVTVNDRSGFPWSSRVFQVESVSGERPNPEHAGGHYQRVRARALDWEAP